MPTITSHRAASSLQATPERFWIPLDFRCRRWRPAKLRGHSVSSTLPCISFRIRAKGAAGTFQRGMLPNPTRIRKPCFSKARPPLSAHTPTESCSTQQAWMNSRNQTTIARRSKHRQPVLLHPTDGISSGLYQGARSRRLPIPASTSTLQVFRFI